MVSPEDKRRYNLWTRYRITPEQYSALYRKCGGRCPVCRKSGKHLCVDHCHGTHAIRGLLCKECNRAIGMLGDTEEALKRAWEYIHEYERSAIRHRTRRPGSDRALSKDDPKRRGTARGRDVRASKPARNPRHR